MVGSCRGPCSSVPHGDGGGVVILLGSDQGLAQDVHILSLSGEAGHLVCPVHRSLHLAHTLICGDQLPQLSQQLRRRGLWLLSEGLNLEIFTYKQALRSSCELLKL